MEFFRGIIRSLARSVASSLLQVVSEKVIREALVSREGKFTWSDDDQKVLQSFFAGPTGGKLLYHLDSSLNGMLVAASGQEDHNAALGYLQRAKGFSLAIGLIKLSMPTPYMSQELDKKEEEESKQEDPFVQVKSSPTIF